MDEGKLNVSSWEWVARSFSLLGVSYEHGGIGGYWWYWGDYFYFFYFGLASVLRWISAHGRTMYKHRFPSRTSFFFFLNTAVTQWSNPHIATYFPYFHTAQKRKKNCFSREMGKYSKWIWGNRFAFIWCLKLYQAKAQAEHKVQHAGDRLKVNTWNTWLSGMCVVNIHSW